jgi:hypothetical protein
MQENTCHTPRRWQRQPSKIQISLGLEYDRLKADESATAIDISPSGVSVRTKLALVPGEWVKVAAKGEFKHAIPAHVVWTREDESGHSTCAGLELF